VTAAALAAIAVVVPLPGFRSPTGNIRCWAGHGALHCSLAHADYAASLQAACGRIDWHGFELPPRRRGAPTCSGGILYVPQRERPVFRLLPYGRTWRSGPFACSSARTGVTCRNRGGHTLVLSRERYRLS
jgi:hypothetical protein